MSRSPQPDDRAGASILVVEDNQLNELVVLGLLRLLGQAADVARNGEEAVAALHRRPYAVVLMDIAMPVLDGVAATHRIRRDLPAGEQPYVIAVTAHAFAEDRDRALAAGMDDYLAKPLTKTTLREALQRSGVAL